MSDAVRVAILDLDRAGGLGARRRLATMQELFEAAGAEVTVVRLTTDHRATTLEMLARSPRHLALVARGRAVPEALRWSVNSTMEGLREWDPTLVICLTGRAFHPALLDGRWTVILDFVDRLSVSYGDRSTIVTGVARRMGYRLLSRAAARFEARPSPPGVRRVAAGWADAEALGAAWLPIPPPGPRRSPAATSLKADPDHDLVFVGNLSYPPNVAGLRRLDRLWPRITERRPTITALIAGAWPTPEVRAMSEAHGWTLIADFDDPDAIWSRSRLAIVPLEHASGIQIKVLEAAAHGVAQVVARPAMLGLAPGFPTAVVDNDDALIDAVAHLLEDDSARAELAARARERVDDEYSIPHWTPWAAALLDSVTTP